MRRLFVASIFLGSVSFSAMAFRLVRAKMIAMVLGPSGTGIVSQFTLFLELLRFWADLGMRSPVMKHVSEVKDQRPSGEKYRQVITTSYFMTAVASVVTSLLAIVLAPRISLGLFGDTAYSVYLVVVALIVPVAAFNAVTASILKGNLEYKEFTRWTITGHFLGLLFTPPVVYFFGLWGAVFVYFFFFGLPLAGYLMGNLKRRFLAFSRKINFTVMKEQLVLGLSTLYSGSLNNLSRLLIASWIIKDLGLDQMGIYQVVFTFSSLYLTIPMQSMGSYSVPVIAAAKDDKEIVQAMNDNLRVLSFFLMPLMVALIVFPELAIRIFYTAEFLPAVGLLRMQLIASFFMMINSALSLSFIARGKAKEMLYMSTFNWGGFAALTYLLLPSYGLMGVAWAFTLSRIAVTGALWVVQKKLFAFRFFMKNQKLLMFSAIWITLAMLAGRWFLSPWVRVFAFLLVVPWFFICSTTHERKVTYNKVLEKFQSIVKES